MFFHFTKKILKKVSEEEIISLTARRGEERNSLHGKVGHSLYGMPIKVPGRHSYAEYYDMAASKCALQNSKFSSFSLKNVLKKILKI